METKAREAVPASEFTRNFGHYRVQAHRGAVPVTSHGRIAGYFVSPEDYEDYERARSRRRSFATLDLPEEKVEAISKAEMHRRHAHLDKLLEDEQPAG